MTLEHEVRALLAMRLAAAVDRAAKAKDDRLLLSVGPRLAELLDTLPVRESREGVPADDGSGGRAKILEIMHSPPEVGDAADS